TLAERYNEQDQACIEAELATVRDAAGLRTAFGRLIDTYYAMFLAEPVRRDIWSGTEADKALQDVNLADSRANGALLAGVLARLNPRADRAALAASAFLMWHLAGAAVRLAVSVGRAEGDRLVAAVKRMMLREIPPG
ncbi:MAG: TetR/AcrR family transcriptional regulator, partial [Acidimicrobiales bacterium]